MTNVESAAPPAAAPEPWSRRTEGLPLEVVIPLRWDPSRPRHLEEVAEMREYLSRLSILCDVLVVDGSPPPAGSLHHRSWAPFARIVEPEGAGANGKVVGSLTGLRHARHERVVLSDDDVRHDADTLRQLSSLLDDADLVRPQNVYDRWVWPARWDFGRCLVNRAFGADWPGTFALRRSAVLGMGGWSTEVLFENLQLVRTAQAAGLRVVDAPWVLVPRTPPTPRHFHAQRIRQAYDDLAQPGRLAAELAILPLLLLLASRRPRLLPVPFVAVVLVAETGRRRFGRVSAPSTSAVWAAVWLLERSLTVWVAVGAWARGGVRYHGRRVRHAALKVERAAP